jgi:hypothetical protein
MAGFEREIMPCVRIGALYNTTIGVELFGSKLKDRESISILRHIYYWGEVNLMVVTKLRGFLLLTHSLISIHF